MKHINFLTLLLSIIFIVQAQKAQPNNVTIDDDYWYESRIWKSDSVLMQLFNSINQGYREKGKSDLSIKIQAEWDAEIKHLSDSLGLNRAVRPDTATYKQFLALSEPINSKYSKKLSETGALQWNVIEKQIEAAFIEAARKYYINAGRVLNK